MDNQGPNAGSTELPQAEVRASRQRRISSVWIIPVVAAIVAGGLAWRTVSENGPTITISLENADGLEAGKTIVSYLSVPVGTVEDVALSADIKSVVVTVKMSSASRRRLNKDAKFWVVRPRMGAGGVSGLSTLVSGNYIGTDLGPEGGEFQNHFVALEDPPLQNGGGPGLAIELVAEKLGGLSKDAPIYHREVLVGSIEHYALAEDGGSVVIQAVIETPYAKHVYENSTFWNVSGIDVTGSLAKGVDIDVDSLRSIIAGGVAFATGGKPGKPALPGARFALNPHKGSIDLSSPSKRGARFVVESTGLGSIAAGDSVSYRGEQVGEVLSHHLHDNARTVGILIQVDEPYSRLVRTNTIFWNASGISTDIGLTGLHVHAESLEALLAGGLSFATPDKPGPRAKSGSVFELKRKEKGAWKNWSPSIWLGSESQAPTTSRTAGGEKPAADDKAELHHHKGDEAGNSDSHHWFSDLFHRGK
jgi:paraquat-inducible protein B